ncbi:hypothetical protein DPEC_G00155410 [Dallia pectoralis]|uniref:Uncharacterized protein n=1 Tax=Dallia pectoralis TaxID=75939 RepID=A0ACC2GKF8_DALPE|nr:hypothetical protein DPEC_G00155410 [Dallia pectoralis]
MFTVDDGDGDGDPTDGRLASKSPVNKRHHSRAQLLGRRRISIRSRWTAEIWSNPFNHPPARRFLPRGPISHCHSGASYIGRLAPPLSAYQAAKESKAGVVGLSLSDDSTRAQLEERVAEMTSTLLHCSQVCLPPQCRGDRSSSQWQYPPGIRGGCFNKGLWILLGQ